MAENDPLSTFDDIADKIMARPEVADAAPPEPAKEAAPVEEAREPPTPVAASTEEKTEAAAPARDESGKFVAAAETPAPDEFLVTIKGPWGEEKLDPRKPEDKARLIEYGQKGRNYQELLAKDDQRVAKRAQEALFDNYRALGLIGVNPDGTTFWTPKGLRVMQDEGAKAPDVPTTEPTTVIPDNEVDRLVDRVMATEDPAEARKALTQAISIAGRKYGEEGAKALIEAFKTEQVKERATEAEQRRQAEANGSLVAKVQKRFADEVGKFSVLSNPRLQAAARELVRQRTAALESAGVPGMDAFEQGLLEVGLYVGLRGVGRRALLVTSHERRRSPE